MFCPECGIEEREANQFCRSCGVDMRRIRLAVQSPDSITASAVSARDEIGRAIADKIRESRGAEELAVVAEEVLPEIEKFLESPEERRMRRMRTGMILSGVGLGTALGIRVVSLLMKDEDIIFLAALGIVAFFLGIAFILNGLFLSVPKTTHVKRSSRGEYSSGEDPLPGDTNDLLPPPAASFYQSVTENTTKTLKEKLPRNR